MGASLLGTLSPELMESVHTRHGTTRHARITVEA
jgi:hypothetical protein